MANEEDVEESDEKEKPEGEEAEQEAPKSKKKGILLGGGIIGLVAAAYIVSLVAFPAETAAPPFEGPFLADLSAGDVQVNLRGDAGRRYLVMTLRAEYEGYDEAYVTARIADPVYQAKLQDELIGIARQKTREDVEDRVGSETLLVEIQEAVEPLLFPVHVGNPTSATKPDELSGLRTGSSHRLSSMRGGFRAHVIHLDQEQGTISLDDGPVVEFDGTETDLELVSENGLSIYVDTTGVIEGFVGDVNVGTFGRVLSILKNRFLIQ